MPATEVGRPSRQPCYRKGHQELQWLRHERRCQTCNRAFFTAELDEDFLRELVVLHMALARIKYHAEDFTKEWNAGSAALVRLTRSLKVVRALAIYQDTDDFKDRAISDLEMSVRATNSLQAAGIMTASELCNHTGYELLGLRNFGDSTLHEVRQRLAEIGLRLRGD